jgi:hypothetical protein
VVLICNPSLSSGDRNLDAFINTSCFAPAPKGSIGLDSGYDRLGGPGLENQERVLQRKRRAFSFDWRRTMKFSF